MKMRAGNEMMVLKSADEMWVVLRLRGLGISRDEAAAAWSSMPEPIRVRKKMGRMERIVVDYHMLDGHAISDSITRLAKRWQKGDTRFCLWSGGMLEIAGPGNPRYNYLDEGFHHYLGTIIRTNALGEETARDMGRYIRKWNRRVAITMEELLCVIEDGKRAANRRIREGMKLRTSRSTLERVARVNGWKVGEDYVEAGGRRFGVKGKRPEEFMAVDASLLGDHRADTACMEKMFSQGMAYLQSGRYTAYAGSITIDVEVVEGTKDESAGRSAGKKPGAGVDWRIEGESLGLQEAMTAFFEAAKYEEKEKFVDFVRELSSMPLWLWIGKNRGIYMSYMLEAGATSSISLKLADERGKLWLEAPGWKRFAARSRADVKNALATMTIRKGGGYIPALSALGSGAWANFLITHEGLVQRTAELLIEMAGPEAALEIMQKAEEDARKALERSKTLLEQTLEKHRDRIREFVVRKHGKGRKGWLVKGDMRSYFVTKNGDEVWTFPGMRYVCLVDSDAGEETPLYDRLVARMMLLLNDSMLWRHVRTLGRGGPEGADAEYEAEGDEWDEDEEDDDEGNDIDEAIDEEESEIIMLSRGGAGEGCRIENWR